MTEGIQSHVMGIASRSLAVEVDPMEEIVGVTLVILERGDLMVEGSRNFLTYSVGELVVLGAYLKPLAYLLLDLEDEAGGAMLGHNI